MKCDLRSRVWIGPIALWALTGCSVPSLIGEDDDAGVSAAKNDGCAAWLVRCGDACVDTFSSDAHCGGCGRACSAGTGCVDGRCVPSVPTGPPPAGCVGGGPAIALAAGDPGSCTGALAASSFTRALCACGERADVAVAGRLLVDGFDSTAGPYAPGAGAGSLAANGTLRALGTTEIAGDLELGAGWTVAVGARVAGMLRTRSLVCEAPLMVGGDAYVAEGIAGPAASSIAGTLHTALACDRVPPTVAVGACSTERVEIEEPCRCGDLRVADLVEFHTDPAQNDDDDVGLAPEVLAGPSASGRIDLQCGRYLLTRIAAGGPVTIAAHGHVALFVAGSVLADAPIALVASEGATLDVFVAGALLARAPLRIGSPERPAATRLWVGGICRGEGDKCELDADCCAEACTGGRCAAGTEGDWSVALGPRPELGALVAAAGRIRASGPLEAYGALLGEGFDGAAAVALHFDRAAGGLSAECEAAADPCPAELRCGPEQGCSDGLSCVGGCCRDVDEP